jgi:hypothetical protein
MVGQTYNKLDEILARVSVGERLEDILADYPLERDELVPLVLTAKELQILRNVPPPSDAESGFATFMWEAETYRRNLRPHRQPWTAINGCASALREIWWQPSVRLGIGALFAFIVLLSLLFSTIPMADGSLPGDWAYPLKLTGEQVRLAFTFDDAARAQYLVELARTRSEEIQRSLQAGRPLAENALVRLNSALEASLSAIAASDPSQIPSLLTAVEDMAMEQSVVFSRLERTVTISALRQRLAVAQQSLDRTHSLANAGQEDVLAFSRYAQDGSLQAGSVFSALVGDDQSMMTRADPPAAVPTRCLENPPSTLSAVDQPSLPPQLTRSPVHRVERGESPAPAVTATEQASQTPSRSPTPEPSEALGSAGWSSPDEAQEPAAKPVPDQAPAQKPTKSPKAAHVPKPTTVPGPLRAKPPKPSKPNKSKAGPGG